MSRRAASVVPATASAASGDGDDDCNDNGDDGDCDGDGGGGGELDMGLLGGALQPAAQAAASRKRARWWYRVGFALCRST
jgi:hypothetical protein